MKYVKSFTLFEAVILPNKIDSNHKIKSIEDLIEYGNKNDFDVVRYDDFYNSLNESDRKGAPPKSTPFFALFHSERKKIMFVVNCSESVFKHMEMKDIVDDIIGHELIHSEQSRRMGYIKYSLPSTSDKKDYLSNKEEIMAFSWTIANDISKRVKNVKDGISLLSNGLKGESYQIWYDIKKNCDEKVIKRYKKYIYMYLEKIFNKD